MKKMVTTLLSLTMASAMLLGSAAGVYNVSQVKKADALYSLGLFQGSDKGYELEAGLDRSQSVALLLRMLGVEAAAEKSEYSHPFTDVPKWADKYIAYAYENGYVEGYSDTRFGGTDRVTDYQYLTIVLRALGYTDSGDKPDFDYRSSAKLAKELGLVASDADDTDFVRGNAVEILWNALNTPLKGGNVTLAERLIEQKIFTRAQLDAAAEIAKNGKSDGGSSGDTSGGGSAGGGTPGNTSGGGTSETKKPQDYTWEEYEALEDKDAFIDSFESPEAFMQWQKKAKAEYDSKQNVVKPGADGSVDIGDLIGKKN